MRSADVSEKRCIKAAIIASCLCTMVDVKNVSTRAVAPFLRAFVDADEHWTGVPERLAGVNTKAGAMEAPHKECRNRHGFMLSGRITPSVTVSFLLVFSHAPFYHLVLLSTKVYGLTDEQQESAIINASETHGPVPRIFTSSFVKDGGKLSAYLCQAELGPGGLTASDLRRLVLRGGNLDGLDLDAESHTNFLLGRGDAEKYFLNLNPSRQPSRRGS
jgi:hypothetical protein